MISAGNIGATYERDNGSIRCHPFAEVAVQVNGWMMHALVSFEEDSHYIDKDINSHDQYHEVIAMSLVISPYDCMQMPLWKNIIRKPT